MNFSLQKQYFFKKREKEGAKEGCKEEDSNNPYPQYRWIIAIVSLSVNQLLSAKNSYLWRSLKVLQLCLCWDNCNFQSSGEERAQGKPSLTSFPSPLKFFQYHIFLYLTENHNAPLVTAKYALNHSCFWNYRIEKHVRQKALHTLWVSTGVQSLTFE